MSPDLHLPDDHELPAVRMRARREHLVAEIGRDLEKSPRFGWRFTRPALVFGAAASVVVLLAVVGHLAWGGSSLEQKAASVHEMAGIIPDETADGYVALVPRIVRSGEKASFSISLLKGERPVSSNVRVALFQKDTLVAEGAARIKGQGTVQVQVPRVASGEYRVTLQGAGIAESTAVQIQPGTLLFLESDKPIYKPGQTVHVRLVALDSELKPVPTDAIVEIQDAKAIKVLQEDGDHRRVRHGHHRAAAVDRAQPGRLEADRHRGRGLDPVGRAGGGVRPAQVRSEGRSGEAVVPGQRAHHRARDRAVQLRPHGEGRAQSDRLPLRGPVGGVRHLRRPRSTGRATSASRRRATWPGCRRPGAWGT